MAVHGNSYDYQEKDVLVGRYPIWGGDVKLYPSGAYATKEQLQAAAKDGVVPAGTPVSLKSIGGTITFNATEGITGMTYQDIPVKENGGTVDIVTFGEFYETYSKATISPEQKAALSGRITFISES